MTAAAGRRRRDLSARSCPMGAWLESPSIPLARNSSDRVLTFTERSTRPVLNSASSR